MGDDAGKGGYNVFETFGVTFLDILNGLRQKDKLTLETFLFAKKKMWEYLCLLYYQEVLMPTKHTFRINNAKDYMGVYYSGHDYRKMVLKCRLKAPLARLKRTIIK